MSTTAGSYLRQDEGLFAPIPSRAECGPLRDRLASSEAAVHNIEFILAGMRTLMGVRPGAH